MTELSWLLDLLLKHELDDKTKKHVAKRISAVEKMLSTTTVVKHIKPNTTNVVNGAQQSPSTLAAMARHEQGIQILPPIPSSAQVETQPGLVVASPAAAQAMQARQIAVNNSINGVTEKGRTSPRKF